MCRFILQNSQRLQRCSARASSGTRVGLVVSPGSYNPASLVVTNVTKRWRRMCRLGDNRGSYRVNYFSMANVKCLTNRLLTARGATHGFSLSTSQDSSPDVKQHDRITANSNHYMNNNTPFPPYKSLPRYPMSKHRLPPMS